MTPSSDPEDRSVSKYGAAYKYRFVVASLIILAHFSVGLNYFSVAPVFPLIMEDFGVNRATAVSYTHLTLPTNREV
mgnify:CR=1 FL=1